jgi:putative endonuclease
MTGRRDRHPERSEGSDSPSFVFHRGSIVLEIAGGRMKIYVVYIVTNRRDGVLYTGMTGNIERRILEHKQKVNAGFAAKYNCTKLVYYDSGLNAIGAIEREKQIKGWLRRKKIALIESMNPEWKDLSDGWYDDLMADPLHTGCADRSEGHGERNWK